MQMKNYWAYLKGYASGSRPSKRELRLCTARRSRDLKKIAEVLNTLLGAEGVGTRIPHLEGEETFGRTKWKLLLPIQYTKNLHSKLWAHNLLKHSTRNQSINIDALDVNNKYIWKRGLVLPRPSLLYLSPSSPTSLWLPYLMGHPHNLPKS